MTKKSHRPAKPSEILGILIRCGSCEQESKLVGGVEIHAETCHCDCDPNNTDYCYCNETKTLAFFCPLCNYYSQVEIY